MFSANWSKNLLTYSIVLVGLILLHLLARISTTLAQDNAAYLREVRAFDPDFIIPNPAGLAFSPEANIFLVLGARKARRTAQPAMGASDLMMITPVEDLVGSVSVAAAIDDPINMAFDSKANRLLLLDTATNELIEIRAGPTGYLDPATITRFDVRQYGLQNPQGMTLDPASGRLFILDNATSRIVRIEPGPEQSLDGAAALKEGRISQVDLKQNGLTDLRSLAFNPTNGHLYLLSLAAQTMVELTETGQAGHTTSTRSSRGGRPMLDRRGVGFSICTTS